MFRILISDEISKQGVELLRKNPDFEVVERTTITPDELKDEIKNYHALIVRSRTKVTPDIINNADNLKLIVRGGVGTDNIDKPSASVKGIIVKNTPKASSTSVAELAFGMMLAGVRGIVDATNSMKSGKWEKKKFEGTELSGKTLGVIGLGNIGKELAKRALAFGMSVYAYDPFIQTTDINGVNITDLKNLLSNSDIISIHCPKTVDTTSLINNNSFEIMKNGVGIINCSRGGIIEESSMLEGLQSGKISFLGLDVYGKEPPEPTNPLFSKERVILTPHIGAQTAEGQDRVSIEVAEVVTDFFERNK